MSSDIALTNDAVAGVSFQKTSAAINPATILSAWCLRAAFCRPGWKGRNESGGYELFLNQHKTGSSPAIHVVTHEVVLLLFGL